jgi:hypothetical protein
MQESFSSLELNDSDENDSFYSKSQLELKKAHTCCHPSNENLLKED